MKKGTWQPAVFGIVAFSLLFFVSSIFAASHPLSQQERQILENQLEELEAQIIETEGIIDDFRQQGRTFKREIGKFDKEISKTSLQIRAIELSINKLNGEITGNQKQVRITEDKLENHKEALAAALQSIYEQETETIVEILLQSPSLSYFFANVSNLLEIQNNLRISLKETISLRDQLLDERENLALRRFDKASLKLYQSEQKKNLQFRKEEKEDLLTVTKGQESKYQEILKVSKKTAAEIRNRIFEFLGGGQLTFEQAYKLAKSAGDLTEVNPALILAVLDKESALGYNVGQCSYKTAMHPKRDVPVFLEITRELGINPDSVTVSCANQDGAYGGAMGPAQFIPTTWKIYRSRIADLTGANPPSPWRNFDAFVGTALYLKDAYNSQSCLNYSQEIPSQTKTLRERCAAAKYYAGSRWRHYRWTYGEWVVEKTRQFEEDIGRISA